MTDDYTHATHYDLLEVARDASADDVKKAWQFQSKVWHPDRFTPGSVDFQRVQRRQQELNAAYEVLSDAKRRTQYDRGLAPEPEEIQVFSLPQQNRAETWKRMASYMKDEDVGKPFHRTMAYTAGDYLERRRQPSEKQLVHMRAAWDLAVADGFDPDADDA